MSKQANKADKQASKPEQTSKEASKQALTRYFHRNLLSLQALTDAAPEHLMHIVTACSDNLNKGYALLDIRDIKLLEKTLSEIVYDLTTPIERNYSLAKKCEVLVNTNYMVFDFIKVFVDKKLNAVLECKPTARPFIIQIALGEGFGDDRLADIKWPRIVSLPKGEAKGEV